MQSRYLGQSPRFDQVGERTHVVGLGLLRVAMRCLAVERVSDADLIMTQDAYKEMEHNVWVRLKCTETNQSHSVR